MLRRRARGGATGSGATAASLPRANADVPTKIPIEVTSCAAIIPVTPPPAASTVIVPAAPRPLQTTTTTEMSRQR